MKPFILTVDTEPDDVAWRGLSPRNLSFASLEGLRRFGALARQFSLKPTLLVSYSVAVHPDFARLAVETGLLERSEIGAHFHPADTPPFGPSEGEIGDNLLKVPDALLAEKFANLHGELTRRFGAPRSFRGGAWTLDARVVRLLQAHGYKVDTTVTPGISWLANNRPSYLQAPPGVYVLGTTGDLSHPGDSGILEIPVSIHADRSLPPWMASGKMGSLSTMPMYSRRVPLMALWRKLRPRAPVWMRPAFTAVHSMRQAASGLEGAGYLHGMCHSNEFWPGTSPYSSDAVECDAFFARLEGLCRVAQEGGYRSMTLLEAAEVLEPAKTRGAAPRETRA